jgi:hypothetical protein
MDISNITTEELMKEIETRSEKEKKDGYFNVIGTIGIDAGVDFVETFTKINSYNDLPDISAMRLRARFNSHRYYEFFYFKTNSFEVLKKNLNKDNEQFANWIRETESIKFIDL